MCYFKNQSKLDRNLDYYECTKRRNGCTYRVHVNNLKILKEGEHNHLTQYAEIQKIDSIDFLVSRSNPIGNLKIGMKRVYNELVNQNINNKFITEFNSIRATAYKRSQSKVPKRPEKIKDVPIDDDIFKLGVDNGECILKFKDNDTLILTADNLLFELINSENKLGFDGTFFSAPELFYQLVIAKLYIPRKNIYVNVGYGLLSDKKETPYRKFFKLLKNVVKDNTCEDIKIKLVNTDFEKGIINSITKELPETELKGCWVHHSRLTWGALQTSGAKEDYITDDNLKREYQRVRYLAYMKEDQIKEMFKELKSKSKYPKLKLFYSYYEKNWLNGFYKLSMFNYYDNDLIMKTTNANEGENFSINNEFNKKPGLYNLNAELKKRIRLDVRKLEIKTKGRKSIENVPEKLIMEDYVYEINTSSMKDFKKISFKYLNQFVENHLENKKKSKII